MKKHISFVLKKKKPNLKNTNQFLVKKKKLDLKDQISSFGFEKSDLKDQTRFQFC